MTAPNFLILYEPTNNFDIDTLNVLEYFLEAFGGNVIVVSHDRYFLDKICNHIFAFEEHGKIKDYPGNYTYYKERKAKPKEIAKPKVVAPVIAEIKEKETSVSKKKCLLRRSMN